MTGQVGIFQSVWDSIPSLVANITILTIFLGVVIAGVARGIKEFKGLRTTPSGTGALAAATILENVTLNEWSNSNREVRRALMRLSEETNDHRLELKEHAGEMRATIAELRDMRRTLNALLAKRRRGQSNEN